MLIASDRHYFISNPSITFISLTFHILPYSIDLLACSFLADYDISYDLTLLLSFICLKPRFLTNLSVLWLIIEIVIWFLNIIDFYHVRILGIFIFSVMFWIFINRRFLVFCVFSKLTIRRICMCFRSIIPFVACLNPFYEVRVHNVQWWLIFFIQPILLIMTFQTHF